MARAPAASGKTILRITTTTNIEEDARAVDRFDARGVVVQLRTGCLPRGLPGYRLKRVLDHIGDNFAEDLSLSQLAAVARISPHYFVELFKQSTGQAPHRYLLLQRIERAKRSLRQPGAVLSMRD